MAATPKRSKPKIEPEIIFRYVGDVQPSFGGPAYYVEYHHLSVISPVGFAYVTLPPDSPPKLAFVLVSDLYRRRGVARQLLKACLARWPDIRLAKAVSHAGEELLAAVWADLEADQ